MPTWCRTSTRVTCAASVHSSSIATWTWRRVSGSLRIGSACLNCNRLAVARLQLMDRFVFRQLNCNITFNFRFWTWSTRMWHFKSHSSSPTFPTRQLESRGVIMTWALTCVWHLSTTRPKCGLRALVHRPNLSCLVRACLKVVWNYLFF